MLLMHGAAWLSLKAEGPSPPARAADRHLCRDRRGRRLCAGGLWLAFGIDGFAFAGEVVTDGPSNPLYSEVARGSSWLAAYAERPWIAVAPLMGFVGIALAVRGLRAGREVSTLLWSKLGITGIIAGRADDVPVHPALDGRSEQLADRLGRLVLAPDAVHHAGRHGDLHAADPAYTAWVYKVLWGKVTEADVTATPTPSTEKGPLLMWYFAWLLGLPLAAIFAVMNAMWLEMQRGPEASRKKTRHRRTGCCRGIDGRGARRVVIIGAGAAGSALANRLRNRLQGADITVVDPRVQHLYQPGLTLVAAG
jgi:cyd operon protein YbgT